MANARLLTGLALIVPAMLTLSSIDAAASSSAARLPADPYSATAGFYVDPDNPAASWARSQPGSPQANAIASRIGSRAQAKWFAGGPDWVRGEVDRFVTAAAERNQLPTLVAYNLPQRDCGQYSAGGTTTAQYGAWIRAFSAGVGNRPAVVLVEPDSLFLLSCLSANDSRTRLNLLNDAVNTLAANAPRAWVYLDGGDGHEVAPQEMADRLRAAGVARARGFAVNVSNFHANPVMADNARQIQAALSARGVTGAGYVIDSSRNGNGSNEQWCNPDGRKLGAAPQRGGSEGADALLWVKNPGTSDGNCGTGQGTQSGEFVPRLATSLM